MADFSVNPAVSFVLNRMVLNKINGILVHYLLVTSLLRKIQWIVLPVDEKDRSVYQMNVFFSTLFDDIEKKVKLNIRGKGIATLSFL
jgi:hypothetical protein